MSADRVVAASDLAVGSQVPPVDLTPVLEDLVRWAAAGDDYTRFHYDAAAAAARGFEGPVVHGTFQAAQLAELLTKWLGPEARLRALECRYRKPLIVDQPMRCRAVVTAVEAEGDDRLVSFDLRVDDPEGIAATTGTAIAWVPGTARAASLVTPELLAALQVGEVSGRYTFAVTRERIKAFAAVLADLPREQRLVFDGDAGEGPPRDAPAAFFGALDPLELKIMSHDRGLDLIPYRRTGGGNAFNEVEYERPIRSGDLVSVAVTYTEVYERSGRSGRLLFRVREGVLTDQSGDRIGVTRSGHVYAYNVAGEAGSAAPPPTPRAAVEPGGEELPPLTRTPTTMTLVEYAAAADDYAPLHYDHNYARTRGYDGVIVHGFLKAGYMATLVEHWAGAGAFVKRFRAEYRGPDYPDRPITCRGRVVRWFEENGRRAVDLDLWVERADGSISTKGTATVLFAP